MRPRKPICLLALGVFLIQTTGCYSFGPPTTALPREPGGPGRFRTVVVTQKAGQSVEVRDPWMDSPWIGGKAELSYPEGPRVTEVRFSLDDVESIQEKRFSRVKTIILVGCAAGLSAILPLIVADVFKGPGPKPGPGN